MNRGFTLIELLVVIAIIGVLSSVILVSLNTARARARDAEVRTELAQIRTAIQLYYTQNGSMPPNIYPTNYCSNQANFLQSLVTAGYLPPNITSPNNSTYPYCYYDYGTGTTAGAIVTGWLEAATPPSTAGFRGTCRPFGAGTNWCDQSINGYYCLCSTY